MVDPPRIVLSEYRELRRLRAKHFETIHLCVHVPTGRHVTLIKGGFVYARATYFGRMAQVMHQMTHPATLACRGVLLPSPESPGALVTHAMPNGFLADVNRQVYGGMAPAAWGPTARSKAVVGILAGMCFVHLQGLIHRSLCPENILLDENWEVQIAGFNRARPAGWVHHDKLESKYIPILPCMAPDDILSGGRPESDVYSFAVCLYALFLEPTKLDDGCSIRPNHSLVQRAVLCGARFVGSELIPPFYWELIKACWCPDPDERPSFADLLMRFRTDRRWILEGSDAEAVAEYERRVSDGIPAVLDERTRLRVERDEDQGRVQYVRSEAELMRLLGLLRK